jgi:RNA polymerase primary sigma factor
MKPTKKELKEISASLYESNGLLTAEQEANLVRQIREGNMDALSELLEVNIRFVISVAKNYRDNGVEIPELVAAGTKGLVHAAQIFDESQDVRFFSYAIWWIRHYMIDEIEKIK